LSEAEGEQVARGLLSGLRLQFEALARRRAAGDELIGWKVGLNATAVQQHFGITRPVLGHLTTASLIEPGSTHSLAGGVRVGVEPEVAIHLGAGGKIAKLGPAIEVVDLDPAITELDSILAGNVFHRGLVLGPALEGFDPSGLDTLTATIRKNGSVAESARFADTGEAPGDVVTLIGERLALVGERLAEGQVIIAGSLTPIVFVEPGDGIEVQLGPLGSLAISLA
jgi:2-keto-4-pentenoate hydratase